MELFSIHRDLSLAAGKVKAKKRGTDGHVSHLLFGYDLLIFTKGSAASIKKINNILEMLAQNTGLLINKDKSKIIFSKGCSNKVTLLQVVGGDRR